MFAVAFDAEAGFDASVSGLSTAVREGMGATASYFRRGSFIERTGSPLRCVVHRQFTVNITLRFAVTSICGAARVKSMWLTGDAS